VPWCSVFD
jgi:hypothetical protein